MAGPTLGVWTPKFTAFSAEKAKFQAHILKPLKMSEEELEAQSKKTKGKKCSKDDDG